METIGIRELRQHASRWLRRVRAGEAFEITDRGRPVARLVPLGERGGLAKLVAEGRATAALRSFDDALEAVGPPLSGESLTRELERLRSDER